MDRLQRMLNAAQMGGGGGGGPAQVRAAYRSCPGSMQAIPRKRDHQYNAIVLDQHILVANASTTPTD